MASACALGFLLAALLAASGCGSISASWPGIPVSIGMPLGGLSKPVPFTFSLAVETDPPGADVLLDGNFVATSPTIVHAVFQRSITGRCLAEPIHRILVQKEGWRPIGLSYTCQLAWDLSTGPSTDRRYRVRLRLAPEW